MHILLPVYSSPPSLPVELRVCPDHLDSGILGIFVLFCQKKLSLRLVLWLQGIRKCSSVSTVPWLLKEHSLSSLGSQVCLCWPTSTARLCSLSLYLVKVFLSFLSDTVVRQFATG